MAASQIHLYTAQTPNGIKISILLEELGLQYKVSSVKFSESEQKKPAFLEINPNGRIPALTDTFTDGKEIRVFESGSIMQYLVDRYDTEHKLSYPAGSREHIETTNWLFFQNAGVGPMQGQANHFTRYAPEQIEYGVNRYQNETRRLYGVLDKHLADSGAPYIVGEKCTIADIAHWGWVAAATWAGVEINDFPALKAWEERMWARPALKKGADVPQPYKMKELLQDKERMEAEAAKSRAWVQQGMKEDAEKHGSMRLCISGALQSSGSIKMSESDALLPKRHVVKFEEGDHDDPRNWPSWRKLLAWLPIVPVDLAVSFGASGYSPVADQVSETFAVSTQTAVLGLSIYTLALAFGPLLNAPVSENYGRLPVYVVLYGLSLPCFAGTALAPSWTVFLVMRFFTGLFQSVTIANLGGTIADLYDFQHTGVPMSIFIWAATGGSSIGYLLLSIVAQHRPWQDVFWTLLTICGSAWAVMCCCIVYAGETRQSVLLRRIAEKRQQETGERQDVPEEYKSKGLKHLIVAIQARPLRFLFTEAIISCAAAYNGYLYGISFLLNGAFALVFGDGHELNTMQVGLCFAGVIAGISLGPLTNLLQDHYYLRVSQGVNKPEARLQSSKVAAVALPLSLFWFAWTTYSWIHPVVPVLATVAWGWSFFTLILMTYMYTEDSYGEYSGSALAALGFVRNAAGAAFPLFGRQMYDKLGYQWASTTLAFLALIMVPIPFFLDSLGKRLRKRSPYASEQFDPAEE